MTWTHERLVEKAGWWLRVRRRMCPVLLEPGYGGGSERPDAWGMKAGASTVIECKSGRADFLADYQKAHRFAPSMGAYRYYMAPRGVVDVREMFSNHLVSWGLLEVRGDRVFEIKKPLAREGSLVDTEAERRMLAGALANVQYRDTTRTHSSGRWETENLGRDPVASEDRARSREREVLKRRIGEILDARELPWGADSRLVDALKERIDYFFHLLGV